MDNSNQIRSGNFWPLFWTQFLGAMNDNVFKNAVIILITFKSYAILGLGIDQMVALCGGIFILPFFLFSSISGQYSDKFPKNRVIVFTKILEVIIMLIGSLGFMFESIILLLISLFLMGTQSTIFGPAKYSILPELLAEKDLVKGNAQVEMGTFLAILIGTIVGGFVVSFQNGSHYICAISIILAIIGLISSYKIPKLNAVQPEIKVDKNIFRSTLEIIRLSKKTHSIYISILGISWFWFFGAILLSIFPIYVKEAFNGDGSIVTLFLALFSIGVAIGSIICEKCSHERVELGLVPFGSIGMSLFVLHLYLLGSPEVPAEVISVRQFFSVENSGWIFFDLLCLSILSGFFIVPLYTFIQYRSSDKERSQIIAANNILNAFFMVISAVLLMVLFAIGLKVIDIFLVLFVLNSIVAIYIYTVIPEFLWRFVCVIMGRLIYRLRIEGLENVPSEGSAVIIANHVSFIDWLIISASVKRPVRFVMHYSFMKIPFFSFLLRGAKVIPIAGAKEDPQMLESAFERISSCLKEGELVCIFPEGKITSTGELNPFRAGIEKIISADKVPVIPLVLKGLWGSFFSRKYGSALTKFSVIPKNIFMKVDILIEKAISPDLVTAEALEERIKRMLKETDAD